jgi:hypothetical protein
VVSCYQKLEPGDRAGEKYRIKLKNRLRRAAERLDILGFSHADREAVIRELAEETGIKDLSFLIQLGAYGQLGRDPRGRDISVAFIGIIAHGKHPPKAGSDAAAAVWLPVEELPERLAFDHATILGDALRRLAAGGRFSGVLFAFLNDPFTSEQLGDVLHAVYGVPLAPEEYLAPLVKMKIVRRLKRGRDYRFTGWHEGRRR